MSLNLKVYSAALGLILLQGFALGAEEAEYTGKTSRRIKDAVRAGLPSYNGQPHQPPVENSPAEVDPEMVVLPVVQVSGISGPKKMEGFSAPKKDPLVAGTGITEIRLKKVTIIIPRILFIPIGFTLRW